MSVYTEPELKQSTGRVLDSAQTSDEVRVNMIARLRWLSRMQTVLPIPFSDGPEGRHQQVMPALRAVAKRGENGRLCSWPTA